MGYTLLQLQGASMNNAIKLVRILIVCFATSIVNAAGFPFWGDEQLYRTKNVGAVPLSMDSYLHTTSRAVRGLWSRPLFCVVKTLELMLNHPRIKTFLMCNYVIPQVSAAWGCEGSNLDRDGGGGSIDIECTQTDD